RERRASREKRKDPGLAWTRSSGLARLAGRGLRGGGLLAEQSQESSDIVNLLLLRETKSSAMASLSSIVGYADRFLRIREVGDWDNALNGLQIENSGKVTKIGAAVDVSTRVLTAAAKKDVDLLIVHHGLFWPGLQSVTGPLRRQLKLAFENNISLYSAHLPLDVHPKIGNNAQLASSLALKSTKTFLEEKGELVGVRSKFSGS